MNFRHGMSRGKSSEYRAWQAMKARCTNPNTCSFRIYGGRGVRFDPRWLDFCVFIADIGFKPGPTFSLDRIDPSGDYVPENCRWASPAMQSRNIRCRNRFGISGMTTAKNGNYRVFINADNKIKALGTTPDFFEACCLRKSAENTCWTSAKP